jgi:hypothetical protein
MICDKSEEKRPLMQNMPYEPSTEFQNMTSAIYQLNYRHVVEFMSIYFSKNLLYIPKKEDRPWDLTPQNLMNFSRFLLRFSCPDEGGRLTDKIVEPMLKDYYNQTDPENLRLRRSDLVDDKEILSLRQEYVRAFYTVRYDLYLKRLHTILAIIEKKYGIVPKVFDLTFTEMIRLIIIIVELVKTEGIEITRKEIDYLVGNGVFDQLRQEFCITHLEYDQNFNNFFDYDFFETSYNPLILKPFISFSDETIIPIIPQFLLHRIPELFLDQLTTLMGKEFFTGFNDAVTQSIVKLLNQYSGKSTVHFDQTESIKRRQWNVMFTNMQNNNTLIKIVPNRLENIYSTSCNVLNIYDRISAVIAPTIFQLGEEMKEDRTKFHNSLPLIVTYQPLHARNATQIKNCIQKILINEYELDETFHPRYVLMDISEFELALEHLEYFRNLQEMLRLKRDVKYLRRSFTEFLEIHLGDRFKRNSSAIEFITEEKTLTQRIMKNKLKRMKT